MNVAWGTFRRAALSCPSEISTPVTANRFARAIVEGRPAPQPRSRTRGTGCHSNRELVEHSLARIVDDPSRPRQIFFFERIVALLDDRLSVVIHQGHSLAGQTSGLPLAFMLFNRIPAIMTLQGRTLSYEATVKDGAKARGHTRSDSLDKGAIRYGC